MWRAPPLEEPHAAVDQPASNAGHALYRDISGPHRERSRSASEESGPHCVRHLTQASYRSSTLPPRPSSKAVLEWEVGLT